MLYDFGTFTSVDINECLEESLNDCDGNATCFDTDGGFNCSCNIGYTGNGTEGNCLGMAISCCYNLVISGTLGYILIIKIKSQPNLVLDL